MGGVWGGGGVRVRDSVGDVTWVMALWLALSIVLLECARVCRDVSGRAGKHVGCIMGKY